MDEVIRACPQAIQKEVNEYLCLDRYRPKNDKMAALVALRKLGRQSLRKLLE